MKYKFYKQIFCNNPKKYILKGLQKNTKYNEVWVNHCILNKGLLEIGLSFTVNKKQFEREFYECEGLVWNSEKFISY